LNDILEIEFQLGYAMGIRPMFNDIEFFELIWMYERMAEQRKKENESIQKSRNKISITDFIGGNGG
jgi:hypothetical protein